MPKLMVSPEVKLHYYDHDFTDPWRAPDAIMLQHGFSRNGGFWYAWVPLLARQFRVLRPRFEGHGQVGDAGRPVPALPGYLLR